MKKKSCAIAISLILLLAACGISGYLDDTAVGSLYYPIYSEVQMNISETSALSATEASLELEIFSELFVSDIQYEPTTIFSEPPIASVSYHYLTFEQALLEFATDIVIAQYVGSRPFGQNLTEFEFVVSERILGNAADRVFVYVDFNKIEGMLTGYIWDRQSPAPYSLTFNPGTNYMLPLIRIGDPLAFTHEDGFTFIRDIVINLDDPSKSMMYNEPLSMHSDNFNLNSRDDLRVEIVSFVSELTQHNPPGRDFIRSEVLEDVITKSHYILVVEIVEPLRLAHEQRTVDWGATDIYYVTVIQALEGTVGVESELVVIFPAFAVLPGEQHIVAVEPIEEGSYWFRFSSRNSLFQMEQLDEILQILSHR